MTDKINLAVGLPAYGGAISAHHARMWMEFGSTLGGSTDRFRLTMFSFVDVNPIDRARNLLLDQAVQHDTDWLLMIDADTWIEPESPDEDAGFQLLRMLSDAERKQAAAVCAPVARRRAHLLGPEEIMIYEPYEIADGSRQHHTRAIIDLPLRGRSLFEIDACATAVFAFNVRFATHIKASFSFDRVRAFSEDLNFCRLLRESGGKIMCDPRVRAGHLSRPFAIFPGENKTTVSPIHDLLDLNPDNMI